MDTKIQLQTHRSCALLIKYKGSPDRKSSRAAGASEGLPDHVSKLSAPRAACKPAVRRSMVQVTTAVLLLLLVAAQQAVDKASKRNTLLCQHAHVALCLGSANLMLQNPDKRREPASKAIDDSR